MSPDIETGNLRYDRSRHAYTLGEYVVDCGNPFEICVRGQWVKVELHCPIFNEWYMDMDGLFILQFEGRLARMRVYRY